MNKVTRLNRRSSVRHKLQLGVEIYNCGNYLGRATTRDINTDGAFIDDTAEDLFHNDVLELVFIPSSNLHIPVSMKGMVVRGSNEGVGVLFGYGESEFRRLLRALLVNTEQEVCA